MGVLLGSVFSRLREGRESRAYALGRRDGAAEDRREAWDQLDAVEREAAAYLAGEVARLQHPRALIEVIGGPKDGSLVMPESCECAHCAVGPAHPTWSIRSRVEDEDGDLHDGHYALAYVWFEGGPGEPVRIEV